MLGVAPTIICVLWPAGAKRGAAGLSFWAAMASSRRSRICAIVVSIVSRFFSGASWSRSPWVGSSMLALRRSAYRPAAAISSSEAPGTAFRWM